MFERILDPLLSGVTLGCIYSVIGFGLMVFYSVTKILHFSCGEFAMLSGMVSASLYASGVPLPLAIIIGVIASCVASVAAWFAFLRGAIARGLPTDILIFITVGIYMLISSAAYLVWGTDFRELPYFVEIPPINVGGARVSPQDPWIWGVVAVMMVGLSILFDRTLWGKGLRACAVQPIAARLMGISPITMAFISFVLVALLAGVGGVVLAPLTMTNFSMGIDLTIKGLLAGAAGGFNRAQGPIIGGMIFGLVESFTGAFISSHYMAAVPLATMIVILLIRPQGIFGVREEV